jgi:hypothetical protein
MSADDDVQQASLLAPQDRRRVAALLLVRYCGFLEDPKFAPWFERHHDALAAARDIALRICRQDAATDRSEVSDEELDGLRGRLEGVLEDSDPDGPPFETEVVDHLVFATEVLDALQEPEATEHLVHAFERADELAEARYDMGTEDYPGGEWEEVDFATLESEARTADIRSLSSAGPDGTGIDVTAMLARSEAFARPYADVLARCYSNEEAGRS